MDPFTVAIALIIVGAILLIIEAFSPGHRFNHRSEKGESGL